MNCEEDGENEEWEDVTDDEDTADENDDIEDAAVDQMGALTKSTNAEKSKILEKELNLKEAGSVQSCFADLELSKFCDANDRSTVGSGDVAVVALITRKNDWRVLDGEQLLKLIHSLHVGKKFTEGLTTVGMVCKSATCKYKSKPYIFSIVASSDVP